MCLAGKTAPLDVRLKGALKRRKARWSAAEARSLYITQEQGGVFVRNAFFFKKTRAAP